MNTFSKEQLQIIGISGTNGSGKDTLGLALQEQYGYMFITVTDLLRDEARRRNMPIIRKSTSAVSAEWRREFGMDVLIAKALNTWKDFRPNAIGVAIASLRHPAEADRIHREGGIVIWLDADPQVRYNRIQKNRELRGRYKEDQISFESFMATEEAEMHPSGDNATLDMAGVKAIADVSIMDDAPDVDGFVKTVVATLGINK